MSMELWQLGDRMEEEKGAIASILHYQRRNCRKAQVLLIPPFVVARLERYRLSNALIKSDWLSFCHNQIPNKLVRIGRIASLN